MTSNNIDNINEITTFDEKEYELNKSVQSYDLDDNAYDERWHNLQEFRGSEKEFVLTDKGYELKNNSKTWFYTKDIGLGLARGVVKLTEGVGGLALGTLEKLNLVSDGSVENFANFYQENIYEKMGDTETMAGGLSEGIGQFIIPGIGAYGMFAKLIRAKGAWPFMVRALSAEAVTVGVAQVPGDPNLTNLFSQMFNIDTTKADNIVKEFWNYLATPDVEYGESYNADDVFAEKLRAIIGDAPMGPLGELLFPLFKMFAKGVRKLKGNKEVIEEIDKNIVKASDQEVFTKEFEEFKTKATSSTKLMDAIKTLKNEDGFSITIDGKAPADLGYDKGYMVAPLKITEIKLGDTFTDDDMLKILENVYALEKSLKGEYGEVYVGAWRNADGTYVFDASVRIDNLDQALYIAKSGNQDAIFDLSKLDTIDTGKGYEQLKTDKLFSDDKAIKQVGKTSEIETEFIGTRSKIQTEGAI